jgi:hypothetical protein
VQGFRDFRKWRGLLGASIAFFVLATFLVQHRWGIAQLGVSVFGVRWFRIRGIELEGSG